MFMFGRKIGKMGAPRATTFVRHFLLSCDT